MMTYEDRKKADTEYLATVLWSIGRMLGGSNYEIPLYDDFIHPKPQDDSSAHDIVERLRNKLLKGVTTENGNDGIIPSSG